MARLPRLALGGHLHLALLRAHSGQAVLHDEQDARQMQAALREAALVHRVAIHAYALTREQVLLLATPAEAAALGRSVQDLGRRYASAFNRRHRRTGALWSGRFRSTLVQPGALAIDAMVFVEQDAADQAVPGEALTPQPWSSAAHHLGQARDGLVSELDDYWQLGNTPFEREAAYARRLADGLSANQRQRIAEAVHKGWPLGDTAFVQALAERVDRPVRPRPRGRPASARRII